MANESRNEWLNRHRDLDQRALQLAKLLKQKEIAKAAKKAQEKK